MLLDEAQTYENQPSSVNFLYIPSVFLLHV